MFFISNAILLSLLFVNFGHSQPITSKGHFKVVLKKGYSNLKANGTNQPLVSFVAKQKQTAYNHGSGKIEKEKTIGCHIN